MAENTFAPQKENQAGHILSQFLISFIAWPVWWYNAGAKHLFWRLGKTRHDLWRDLGMKIFLASFFKPMFGLTDIWSRLISLGMRAFLLLTKLGRVFIWLLWALFQIVLYFTLPILALYWFFSNLL